MIFDGDQVGLVSAVGQAERILAANGRADSFFDRYMALRELAEQDVLAGGGRVKAALRRLALSPQVAYDERLLATLRADLLRTARAASPTDRPGLVYVAPFDVLSRNGGAARVLGLARALAARHTVNILSVVGPRREAEVIPVAPGVFIYAVPQSAAFVERIETDRAALGGAAFSLGLHTHLDALPLLAYWFRRLARDAVGCILNQPYLVRLWHEHAQRLPLLYDVPEVNSFFTQRMAAGAGDLDRVRKLQAECERTTCGAAVVVGMASAQDRDALASEQGAVVASRIAMVPNGVWVDEAPFFPPAEARALQRACGWSRPLIIFLGSPAYPPNVEAVRYIADTLAPRHPEAVFAIIGMNAADAPGPAAGRLVFCGRVSDGAKDALLALADVALSPIRAYDSGSSLKIADYVAHGKPVLATPHGWRGFEAIASAGPAVELSALPDALSRMLREVAGDPAPATARASKAQVELKARYDWSVAAMPYQRALAIHG